MSFNVKCRVVGFLADDPHCGFGYEIGDEITYDGERFTGRICPQILTGLAAQVMIMRTAGNRFFERHLFRYIIPPEMEIEKMEGEKEAAILKYLKISEEGGLTPPTERGRGWTYVCPDAKVQVFFVVEPAGLAKIGEAEPFYRREMSMLEKIKAQPGLTVTEILSKFSEDELKRQFPQLHPTLAQILLEELADADYIELRDGKAYPKGSSV
jgi:hypothetical protein